MVTHGQAVRCLLLASPNEKIHNQPAKRATPIHEFRQMKCARQEAHCFTCLHCRETRRCIKGKEREEKKMKKPVQTDKLNTTNKASKWRTKVQHPYRTEVFFNQMRVFPVTNHKYNKQSTKEKPRGASQARPQVNVRGGQL